MNIRTALSLIGNFKPALPTWADYEVADHADRKLMERRWKNAWRNEEAQQLLARAHAAKRGEQDKLIADYWDGLIAKAPVLTGPIGGYRNSNDNDRANYLAEMGADETEAHDRGWNI